MISSRNIADFVCNATWEDDTYIAIYIKLNNNRHLQVNCHETWGTVVFCDGIINFHHEEAVSITLPQYIVDTDVVEQVLYKSHPLGDKNANPNKPPKNFTIARKQSRFSCMS